MMVFTVDQIHLSLECDCFRSLLKHKAVWIKLVSCHTVWMTLMLMMMVTTIYDDDADVARL